MALIAMAVYDTVENKRTDYTKRTLESIYDTVDLSRHRMIIVNNASCEATQEVLSHYAETEGITVIYMSENVGTANAINQAWKHRQKGENLIKMDNDVVIHQTGWVDELEEAIYYSKRLESPIGILGLKRKDLLESPDTKGFYKSTLIQLPHNPGERWFNVEICNHVMGTCQMYSADLIDVIGGLYQMGGLYGFDDSLASLRSQLAGFQNGFLNYIDIDHIDTGGTGYQKWKEEYASMFFLRYENIKNEFIRGEKPLYIPL